MILTILKGIVVVYFNSVFVNLKELRKTINILTESK